MPVKDQAAYKRKRRAEGKDLKRSKPNPENIRAASRRYRERHPERVKVRPVKPNVRANCRLKQKYGMTLAEYDVLFESQKGLCAVCGKPQAGGKRLAVDHDHETEENRELLCDRCNPGLGYFDDDPNLLIRAAQYLIKHKKGARMTITH